MFIARAHSLCFNGYFKGKTRYFPNATKRGNLDVSALWNFDQVTYDDVLLYFPDLVNFNFLVDDAYKDELPYRN